MNISTKEYSSEFIEKEYKKFKTEEIYKYSWIKIIAAFMVILCFGYIDLYVNHSLAAFLCRIFPLTLIISYLFLYVFYFKDNKQTISFFYNTILFSSIAMIYGIIFVYFKTQLLSQSTEGAVLVIAIVCIELQGRIKNVFLVIILPTLILGIILAVNSNNLTGDDLVHFSHIVSMIIIGSIYVIVKDYMNFKAFKDNLLLENEMVKSGKLSKALLDINDQLNLQKNQILEQIDLAQEQNSLLETQKNQITSSLNYAKRIQTALLSSDENFKKSFSEHFIIYKPKDIVSGDFYWSIRLNEWIIFALADCTGHGVPAAFLSILGISFLNEITNKQSEIKVHFILNELRNYIIQSLRQTNEVLDNKDGMDISICAYNTSTRELQFAGANTTALVIRNSSIIPEIQQIKGDKMPVSIYYKMNSFKYQEFQLCEGDQLYLFTDGYADQFGGENGKKIKMSMFKNLILHNSHYPMVHQKKILTTYLNDWMNPPRLKFPQNDDISILAVKI